MEMGLPSHKGAARCWNCGGEEEDHFCQACGKVQPFPKDIDYFQCMGLPRLLTLDAGELERRFHQRARAFHPDFYQGKSEKERSISLENSAILNRAYRVLKDPIQRMEYLWEVEGGKGQGGFPAPPREFLEEIMEVQEALEEIVSSSEEGRQALTAELRERHKRLEKRVREIEAQMEGLSREWDRVGCEGQGSGKKKILEKMGECLSVRVYLTNMLRDISRKIS